MDQGKRLSQPAYIHSHEPGTAENLRKRPYLMLATAVSAGVVAAVLAGCGIGSATHHVQRSRAGGKAPAAGFAAGKAAGLKATKKAITGASPYGTYFGLAVVSLAPTYCARYDPTRLSGLRDNPSTVNVGTPWFLGCIAGIDAHGARFGDTP